jgi:hypothetical protein
VALAVEVIMGLLPQWLLALAQRIPSKEFLRLQNYMKISREVAQALLDRQMALHAQGKSDSKDVMSLLSKFNAYHAECVIIIGVIVRANLSEDPRTKLDDDEIMSQLT